jgi:hypothetical protein
MASDEIKETIVHYFDCTNVQSTEKDWKRVRKFKLDGQNIREFHNAKLNRSVLTIGDDEDAEVCEIGQWVYGYHKADDDTGPHPEGLSVVFEPLDRWNRCGHIYDQHQANLIETIFLIPDGVLDEVMENAFVVDGYDELSTHILLKKHGFLHDPSLTDFLNRSITTQMSSGKSQLVASNPLPPFPALDPNWNAAPQIAQSAPQAPITPSHSLGGYYDTGLKDDGSAKANDFLACVVDDDGDILVQITPFLAFCADTAFDQCVAPLVHHLLPNDWFETSEQSYETNGLGMVEAYEFLLNAGFQVDYKPYKDLFQDSYDVYDVTREQHKANMDAIANPQTVQVQHQHNPIPAGAANSAYPELSGQLLEVQEALEKARQRGVLGLEQENTRWEDWDEIKDKWNNEFYILQHDGEIELERSHGLWLLYEHYDNGSGLAFPNFFGMDDVRVAEELNKIASSKFDDFDEEEGGFVVNEDESNYPTPYDLEVPEYAPPPVQVIPPSIQTSKVPAPAKPANAPRPMMKSPITGSGSFAPVTSGTVAKDEDEVPADSFWIHYDSGEEWPEFCGAVWDHFQQHGPGAIQWSDRFRPRHARIIGLGYKFYRVEFTGILVQMGYLNDKFEIIQNIDIPGAVFDELFQDLGGDWNDDENIQMINKKSGVDPETGFSYSSQNLWEEVEPLLKSKGWLPAK